METLFPAQAPRYEESTEEEWAALRALARSRGPDAPPAQAEEVAAFQAAAQARKPGAAAAPTRQPRHGHPDRRACPTHFPRT